MQMARLVPLVQARGGRVLLECQPELETLLSGLAGAEQVIRLGAPLPPFDVQCPLMSVAGRLNVTVETIPARIPYLFADVAKVNRWREKLAMDLDFKVGIAWASRPNPPHRSIKPTLLSRLGSVPGVRFYSLQQSDTATGAFSGLPPRMQIVDCAPELRDFADTAALLMNLDLILTIDTAVAHLAGALGRPTWVLIPKPSDWRWLLSRNDSPWYPTVRLFRQSRPRDWSAPIQEVERELNQVVRSLRRGNQ
jgi:hypothetical protein